MTKTTLVIACVALLLSSIALTVAITQTRTVVVHQPTPSVDPFDGVGP